jgi:hypothetical protein
MTVSINKIKGYLDSISGMDGQSADIVEGALETLVKAICDCIYKYMTEDERTENDKRETEKMIKEIESVTWYQMKRGNMREGSSGREGAWYQASDILAITDKYAKELGVEK